VARGDWVYIDYLRKLAPLEALVEALGWLKPVSGRYYNVLTTHTLFASMAPGANVLFATYYPVLRRITFDRIACRVTTAGAAGALVRMGIYRDNRMFYPAELLLDAGEVAADTTGEKPVVVDVTLQPGGYWLACITNDAAVELAATYESLCIFGLISSTRIAGARVSQTYGPLPSTFPPGGTYDNRAFLLGMRVK